MFKSGVVEPNYWGTLTEVHCYKQLTNWRFIVTEQQFQEVLWFSIESRDWMSCSYHFISVYSIATLLTVQRKIRLNLKKFFPFIFAISERVFEATDWCLIVFVSFIYTNFINWLVSHRFTVPSDAVNRVHDQKSES